MQRPFGINSRLDALQAAILSAKLPHLEEDNTRRRELAERYQTALAGTPASLVRQTGLAYVAHLAVLRHPQRDRLRSALQAVGIGTDIHYPVLDCDQPGWQALPWRALPLPVSRQACAQVLSLPLYPELLDTEITQICEVLHHTLTV
ncbi:MAG: DegT/DnrJ/EryC1/StrS family aminotransferase [Gammaproteobacteria bacterium]